MDIGMVSRWVGVAMGVLTLAAVGCGSDDAGNGLTATMGETEASATDTTTTTDPTTEASASNEVTGDPVGCAGGAGCGAGDYCYAGGSICTCVDNFAYCTSESPPAGCTPIPEACASLEGEAQEACIADATCGVYPGGFFGGALDCETEECHGDCDLDPDSCEPDTSSGGESDSGGSDSGSSGGATDTTA